METWIDRKRRADEFIPHIKAILGSVFIRESTVDEDQRENTDLMFEMFGRRVAVRVRELKDRAPYNRRNEWTIRLTRSGPEGNNELSRIMSGAGDFYLYGWGDESTKRVQGWTLFDLNHVRAWLFDYVLQHKGLPGQQQRVSDGSFVALCIDDMPPAAIVRRNTIIAGDPEWRGN